MDPSPIYGRVLRVENHNEESLNIRGIFSNVGEIPQLYFFDSGIPGRLDYFVEYAREDSAERALKLGLGLREHLRVFRIASDKHFEQQFDSCRNRGSSFQQLSAKDILTRPQRTTAFNRLDFQPRPPGQREEHLNAISVAGLGQRHIELDGRDEQTTESSQYSSSSSGPSMDPTSNLAHILHSSAGFFDGQGCLNHARTTSPPPYSLETRLVMVIKGLQIKIDLAAPPQDPQDESRDDGSRAKSKHGSWAEGVHGTQAESRDGSWAEPSRNGSQAQGRDHRVIINFLRDSMSERGNWMTAAAHFRRVGNSRAAIEIVEAMLQVMRSSYPDKKLNPAFLLLGACESDLAGEARDEGDEEGYQRHQDQAAKWFQKVFGKSSIAAQQHFPNPLLSLRPTSIGPSSARARPPQLVEIEHRSHRFNPLNTAARKRKVEDGSTEEHPTNRRGSSKKRKGISGLYRVNMRRK